MQVLSDGKLAPITIEASAKTTKDETLFVLELVYAGTVTLGDASGNAFAGTGPLA